MPSQPALPLDTPDSPAQAAAATARDAERAIYLARLREHLADPAFRAIEGFPLGTDEDILALSDPPYYTACPNPFLPEIIAQWQQEREETRRELGLPVGDDEAYHREPYASDMQEGRSGTIYNAHSYHTKVPHRAIMRYILHYTEPGDIVLDGFCGTGMTGVAAQLCGDADAVRALGYTVKNGVVYDGEQQVTHLGARKTVLNDLSPAATFIAYNYNTPVDAAAFQREARRILAEVERECGWMYETWHPHGDAPDRSKGKINYTVWSDVFICPECGGEIIFWDAAVDQDKGKVRDQYTCPNCGALVAKSPSRQSGATKLLRATETVYDRALGQNITRARQVPVLINYFVGKKRYEKAPDAADLALIHKIDSSEIPYWFPINRLPDGDKTSEPIRLGITHLHHFYTRRNLWIFAALRSRLAHGGATFAVRSRLAFLGSSYNLTHSTQMTRIIFKSGGRKPVLTGCQMGTLYVSSLPVEKNLIRGMREMKVKLMVEASQSVRDVETAIHTASASGIGGRRLVDYVFTDPPFGGNLMYSELNYLWEAWLGAFTNGIPEAVVNKTQRKALADYQQLMERCLVKYQGILKPGRWMTVEFHNSKNSVWNAIQEAVQRAGFVVADVRTFDKQQGSFNQVTASGAVKQDLIISAYKPTVEAEATFTREAGTPEGAWAFVREHLARVPVLNRTAAGVLEQVAERCDYVLYDRMVAYHLTRGATVPLSAAQFYAGLRQRFSLRDGMFFLPEQTPVYDRARLEGATVQQLALFLTDEKSAIQWLRRQLDPALGGAPQTSGELQPRFQRELHQARYEILPELTDVLAQNFVQDDRGRWRVPDPAHVGDVEQLRQRALLKEFEALKAGRGKVKSYRGEAVRAGFAACYRQRDWRTIIQVAERLPRAALEEDPDLLMYYDQATVMVG